MPYKTVEEARTDFRESNNFRIIKKSCGNCKHLGWGVFENTICEHPDLLCRDCLGRDGIAYFPIEANNICDKWKECNG